MGLVFEAKAGVAKLFSRLDSSTEAKAELDLSIKAEVELAKLLRILYSKVDLDLLTE